MAFSAIESARILNGRDSSSMLKSLIPRSAKSRVAVVVLAASAVIMALIGVGSYWVTQQRLMTQKDDLWSQVRAHLGKPVAKALWVFDVPGIQAALQAELGGSVLGIEVVDKAGVLVAKVGQPLPTAGALMERDIQVLSMPVPEVEGRSLGRIDVKWSDANIRRALMTTLWLAVVGLVGMSVVLLAVVWFSLNRYVFWRISQLQLALDQAVRRNPADEVTPLQVTMHDEFGAITHSINTITLTLQEELLVGRASEEEAQAALSNLKAAQQGLVQNEKMAALGRLVAGVAHELNTPIGNTLLAASTQKMLAEELSRDIGLTTLTRSSLKLRTDNIALGSELIMSNATRAAELIQNFKQVAVDQTTEQARNFDLAKQIAEVLSIMRHVFTKTSIQVVPDLQAGISMYSYPGPLGQVVTNLVMNAITHGFEQNQSGTITVSCRQEGDCACITVSDNGMGIPEGNMGKLFDPFFTTKMGQGGTGLGLHISYNIVVGTLGGAISVRSKQTEGATFTLRLPLKVAATVS